MGKGQNGSVRCTMEAVFSTMYLMLSITAFTDIVPFDIYHYNMQILYVRLNVLFCKLCTCICSVNINCSLTGDEMLSRSLITSQIFICISLTYL